MIPIAIGIVIAFAVREEIKRRKAAAVAAELAKFNAGAKALADKLEGKP